MALFSQTNFPNALSNFVYDFAITGYKAYTVNSDVSTLLDAQTDPPVSGASTDVSYYDKHSVQLIMPSGNAGDPYVRICTSLDNANWFIENTYNTSTIAALEGKVKYVQAYYITGSGEVTALLLSGR